MLTHLFRRRARRALLGLALAAPLAIAAPAGAAVSPEFDSGNLTVTASAGEAVAITCEDGEVKVGGLQPLGAPLACSAVTTILVEGTGSGANTFDLRGVTGASFTALTAVTVRGGAGNDTIFGSDRADQLEGGEGSDAIVGFRGNDTMLGQDGDDTMTWNPGDDSDVMEGGAGTDTAQSNGGNAAETFTAVPNGARVKFDRVDPNPFNLDIGTSEKLVMNGGGGDDKLSGAAGLAALVVTTITGGDGNDKITGTDGADLITGGPGNDDLVGFRGNDTMLGEDGDDTMTWNPGDDSDVMEGGPGTDTAQSNGGNAAETFTAVASGPRVKFDRVTPNPFTLDIGTSEKLVMNGGGGDDTLSGGASLAQLLAFTADGGAGNDSVTGGDGADLLKGGDGDDRIKARDEAADDVQCGAGADEAQVDGQDKVADCERIDAPGAAPAAPQALAAAADTSAPVVGLAAKRIRVRGGRAALRLSCAAGEQRCVVAVRLTRGGRTVGSATVQIAGGEVKTLRVKLAKALRRQLAAKGTAAVRARLAARDAAGNARTRTVALTLVA